MDTSEEYVKMSDCEEVQSQWPIGMDAMAHPATDSHDYTSTVFRPMKHKDYGEIKQVVTIWLPRQDQIQEMVPTIKTSWGLAYGLYDFAEDIRNPNESYPFTSMEQLWLAYYMSKKHDKVWNGEKWISQ